MRILDSLPSIKTQQFVSDFSIKADSTVSLFPEQKFDNGANLDFFVKTISPKGTTDPMVLIHAPKPDVVIAGQKKKAGIVVDLKTNVLYTYDSNGRPTKAYLVASGAKESPTEKGIRIVTHKEQYPYRSAKGTKRKRYPRDYGPFVVVLKKVDPETGAQTPTGEFIHGCKSYSETFETDPNRYVSHGCVRMENGAITEVKEVKSGTIVIIK